MVKTSRLMGKKIENILCPDNCRRTFYITSTRNNVARGFVQVKGASVTGYAKRKGLGFRFYPLYNGKNLYLVRPATLPLNTPVVVTDPQSPHKGKVGVVTSVEWSYMTPTFSVRLNDRRHKSPVSVTGTDSLAQVGA